jgi:hypothetical protein
MSRQTQTWSIGGRYIIAMLKLNAFYANMFYLRITRSCTRLWHALLSTYYLVKHLRFLVSERSQVPN